MFCSMGLRRSICLFLGSFLFLLSPTLSAAEPTPPLSLFPEIEPYDSGFLKVDDRHEIFYEQSGNPKGIPVLFLHGGPGAGCSPCTGATTTRGSSVSCSTTSAAPGAAGRSQRSPGTPPRSWWRTSRSCASTWGSTSSSWSAAPGARRWGWPMRRRIPSGSTASSCAGSSSAPPARSSTSMAAAPPPTSPKWSRNSGREFPRCPARAAPSGCSPNC